MMGGLVVALTGKNPFKVYHAIWNGTGLNWFFHVGNYSITLPFSGATVWFPWDTASVAAQNLQQTLLLTTPIILTALAVAFAFRCGMFNIGGQGQYIVGTTLRRLGRHLVHRHEPVPARRCSAWSSARSAARRGRASPASSRRPSAHTR